MTASCGRPGDFVQGAENRITEDVSARRVDRINLSLKPAFLVALENLVTDLAGFQ